MLFIKNLVKLLNVTAQVKGTHVPPRFNCQKCSGKMLPKFYIGVKGDKYFYEDFKNKIID